MLSKRIHKYVGLTMLIPMIGWVLTGIVFFVKPGYEGAYEIINLKTYPLEHGISIPSGENWDELRLIRSIVSCRQVCVIFAQNSVR